MHPRKGKLTIMLLILADDAIQINYSYLARARHGSKFPDFSWNYIGAKQAIA
jgi:hypothetical protein